MREQLPGTVPAQEIKESIRQQLHGFYITYDLWLKNGANPGRIFSRNCGLCASLWDYLELTGADKETVLEQLHADFRSAGLNEVLPFNENKAHYHAEKKTHLRCTGNSGHYHLFFF
ncbi:hypothetical protein K3392_14490 [Escherichia coli]|nr:hypothetical protein K3392_14490 [Escherichia coli]